MYQLLLLFFVVLISYPINCYSDQYQHQFEKNWDVLSRDFNKLVINIEDFSHDVLKQLREAGNLAEIAYSAADNDYDWQESTTITSSEISELKHEDENVSTIKPDKENFILKNNKILKSSQKRRKRSIKPNNNRVTLSENEMLSADNKEQSTTNTKTDLPCEESHTICAKSINSDNSIENQKFGELRMEMNRLSEVVTMLRDQQKLMGYINEQKPYLIKSTKEVGKEAKQPIDNNIPDTHPLKHRNDQIAADQGIPYLINGLETTIKKLNMTDVFLDEEKRKDVKLENELKRQNYELTILKLMVKHLFEAGRINFKPVEKQDGKDVDTILGITNTRINKPMSTPANPMTSMDIFKKPVLSTFKPDNVFEKNSELDDVLNDPSRAADSKDDLASKLKILEFLSNRDKESRIDDLKQNIMDDLMKKLLQTQTKSDNERAMETLTNLIKDTQKSKKDLISNAESKTDDLEIENELRQLQTAINSLKPREDLSLTHVTGEGKTNDQNFQSILKHLMKQNAINTEDSPNQPIDSTTNGHAVNHLLMDTLFKQYLPADSPTPSTLIQPNQLFDMPHHRPSNGHFSSPYFCTAVENNHFNREKINADIYNSQNSDALKNWRDFSNSFQDSSDKSPVNLNQIQYPATTSFFPPPIHDPEFSADTQQVSSYSISAFLKDNTDSGSTHTDNSDNSGYYHGQSTSQLVKAPQQYEANVILELTQQIQKLEYAINQMKNAGNIQINDQNNIISLDEKIKELKAIIDGLNRPAYYDSTQFHNEGNPTRLQNNNIAFGGLYQPATFVNNQQNGPIQPSLPYQSNSRIENPTAESAKVYSTASMPEKFRAANYFNRKKRQIEETIASPENTNKKSTDIDQLLRQMPSYELGSDAMTQITDILKHYLDENLFKSSSRPKNEENPILDQIQRKIALGVLQQKVLDLKNQLGSQKSQERSWGDVATLAHGYPKYNIDKYFKPESLNSLQKVDDKSSIFGDIISTILEKVIKILPGIINKLFGNMLEKTLGSVGNSEGDYQSPLQNILKNLGPIGNFPLIFVKLLDTLTAIFKHLKQNSLFRQLLLPATLLGMAGGAVLFSIFFYQQDEPYGYIGYEGNPYNVPFPYSYGNNRESVTDSYDNIKLNDVKINPSILSPDNRGRNNIMLMNSQIVPTGQYYRGYHDI